MTLWFYCWAWSLMVWNILLITRGQLSKLHPAIAKTLVCYQDSFSHKSRTEHHLGWYDENYLHHRQIQTKLHPLFCIINIMFCNKNWKDWDLGKYSLLRDKLGINLVESDDYLYIPCFGVLLLFFLFTLFIELCLSQPRSFLTFAFAFRINFPIHCRGWSDQEAV